MLYFCTENKNKVTKTIAYTTLCVVKGNNKNISRLIHNTQKIWHDKYTSRRCTDAVIIIYMYIYPTIR